MGPAGPGTAVPPELAQLYSIVIRKAGTEDDLTSKYMFVDDSAQLEAVGLTQAGTEIMGIDVDWSTDPKAPGIVTVEDGLVMAETKGSTTIHATNTLRQIRGSLKVTVQKAPELAQLYSIVIRKAGTEDDLTSKYMFVDDSAQLEAVGLTQAGTEIMGIDVDWSTDPKAPGIVTVEDGLVMAETKGSTTIHATNTLRQIRGSLKVTVQKAVDKVVVYDGYADDGDTDGEYATRLRGAEDKGTFPTLVAGQHHRAYAIAYDDEDDMLNDITFEWAESNDKAKATPVKVVDAPKALKTDGSESRSNPGNFKVRIKVDGSSKIMATAIPGDVESEEVSVDAFTAATTTRYLAVYDIDSPVVEWTYDATDITEDDASGRVRLEYYAIGVNSTGEEVKNGIGAGEVMFSEVGGTDLITFTGEDDDGVVTGTTTGVAGTRAVLSDTNGLVTLNFGGGEVVATDVDANTVYGRIGEVTEETTVYVQVKAAHAGTLTIKVVISPAAS